MVAFFLCRQRSLLLMRNFNYYNVNETVEDRIIKEVWVVGI